MRCASGWFLGLLLLSIVALAGCSGGAPPEPESPPQPKGNFKPTPKGVLYKVVETSSLPELKFEVTHPLPFNINPKGPTGWREIPPTMLIDDQILGFAQGDVANPPRIFVRFTLWPDHHVPEPFSENLDPFFETISKRILSELAPKEPLIEDCRLLTIDGRPWVRCVRHHSFRIDGKVVKGEKQILKTIEQGRLFTVELQIRENKILESRDLAYSVAGHLFDKPGEKPAESPMPKAEEKPEEKPADKK